MRWKWKSDNLWKALNKLKFNSFELHVGGKEWSLVGSFLTEMEGDIPFHKFVGYIRSDTSEEGGIPLKWSPRLSHCLEMSFPKSHAQSSLSNFQCWNGSEGFIFSSLEMNRKWNESHYFRSESGVKVSPSLKKEANSPLFLKFLSSFIFRCLILFITMWRSCRIRLMRTTFISSLRSKWTERRLIWDSSE